MSIWDTESHRLIASCLPGKRLMKSSALEVIDELSPYAEFTPDSSRFLTVCMEKRVQAWDSATGEAVHSLGHPAFVKSANYSADGKWMLTLCDDNKARVWDARTAKVIHSIPYDASAS